MASNRIVAFVDANVLANGVLAFNLIRELRAEMPLERVKEEVAATWTKFEAQKWAHLLFSLLRQGKLRGQAMATCHLALLEVVRVMAEEYRGKQLYRLHVPFRRWLPLFRRTDLTQRDYEEIRTGTELFLRSLHVGGARRLRMCNRYSIREAMALVTERSCDARDAIIVASGIQTHSPFLITEDDRLKRQLKNHPSIRAVTTHGFLCERKLLQEAETLSL